MILFLNQFRQCYHCFTVIGIDIGKYHNEVYNVVNYTCSNFLLQEQSRQRSFRKSDDPWVFSLHKVKYIFIFMLCIYISIVFEES